LKKASKEVKNIYLGQIRIARGGDCLAYAEEIGDGIKIFTGSFSTKLRRRRSWTPSSPRKITAVQI